MISEQAVRKTLPRVLNALQKTYGDPPPIEDGSALEMAVRIILHEDSSEKAVSTAMCNLQRDFVDWNEVRVSTAYQVAQTIDSTSEAMARAKEMQALLNGIFRARNDISFEFLREAGPGEAADFFSRIPEISPALAAKIMMLVLGHASLVVSPEILRVAARLDWIREDGDKDQARKRLERFVPKAAMYPFHHLFREHARKTCLAQDPRCEKCPVLKDCPFGREATRKTRKNNSR